MTWNDGGAVDCATLAFSMIGYQLPVQICQLLDVRPGNSEDAVISDDLKDFIPRIYGPSLISWNLRAISTLLSCCHLLFL